MYNPRVQDSNPFGKTIIENIVMCSQVKFEPDEAIKRPKVKFLNLRWP